MLASPQLHPGAGQARSWLLHELSKPEYQSGDPSFVERVGATINELLGRTLSGGTGLPIGPVGAIILGVIVLGIAAVAIWWAGRPRRRSRPTRAGAVFETGEVLTATEHRRRASSAASDGNWQAAVRERFRALVRGLEERTVLDPQPGRTAHEVGVQAAAVLPAAATAVGDAARIFDSVYFGDRPATQGDYTAVTDADSACERTRPTFTVSAGDASGQA